ncbi:MAG TPA: transglutaminase domain-containing protein [Pirellulales bacterium]|nr:transglutaminase domain-containing protein [Pirellulales bacterium]
MRCRSLTVRHFAIGAALAAVVLGCGKPRPAPRSQASSDGHETWDAVYLQENQVGYVHVVERVKKKEETSLIETKADMAMSMKRAGQPISIQTTRQCVEDSEGRLISFREEQQLGPSTGVTSGQVENGKLVITTTDGEHTRTRQIEFPTDAGGPFAPEHSLRRQPMKPGENRSIRFFDPMVGAMATETLDAKDYEQIKLLDGNQKLLHIASSLAIEGQPQPIRGVRWTDADGETLKAEVPGMKQVTYRTTKEQATSSQDEPAFDVFRETLVKLPKPFDEARKTRRVRYAVELPEGDPTAVFSVGPTQHVKSTGEHTAEITVISLDPLAPPREGGTASAEDRDPNSFIQSDDPKIVEMAQEAVGGRASPGEIAVALEEFVSRKMTAKRNYSTAFATAADVARTLEGDCTEHAVLLAALARASGIPARVAIGLVYSPKDRGFAYHMWTEMLLKGGCWVPLDATLGEGRISADHLKLADSNLADRAGLASFLPMVEVLGQLKIEVLEAK